ncbi:hypothetical protein BOX15_Mlig023986g1 [Macrostomum lignano]|uniref:Uncharacterized protein n=1 Tax=Macrostomum lignano TaxID=282301 RepID=A0A267FV72_9PLAT|nr:hypothetical protein BOX15_Mlig023986g1 [Macrostomum lignano]
MQTDWFPNIGRTDEDPENFGHDLRITASTRRTLQRHRELLKARTLLRTRGESFLFGEDSMETEEPPNLQDGSNAESGLLRSGWGNSQLNESRSELAILPGGACGRSRQGAEDLKVFDFVDATKQLIQKGWNSRLFRKHKLAAYNWSYRAPQPLMDGRYFCRLTAKDIAEPAALQAATINSGCSIFTPKYGVSARDTLRENCGILFFTKDIDLDYNLSLRQMRNTHPKLMSGRYYVPFLAFVRALRRNRVERGQPRRINSRDLLTGAGWLMLLFFLLLFIAIIMADPQEVSGSETKKKQLLIAMILAPTLAFVLGFGSGA